VILLLGALFGVDLSGITGGGGPAPAPTTQVPPGQTIEPRSQAEATRTAITEVTLASTEDVWSALYQQSGERYQPPTLVLFDGAVESACGFAQSAVGPFYCPLDRKVYLDQRFFDELSQRFGADGDFAQAFVIAHEVGHHIQTLEGISDRVRSAQGRASEADANALSVRQELQADCLAGVWAYHAEQQIDLLEAGDVEEGLRAAAAVGDDSIQRRTQGYVVPESFTHGTSEQRMQWFQNGFRSGDPNACDTFGGAL
jgi:predicted metalloprotease